MNTIGSHHKITHAYIRHVSFKTDIATFCLVLRRGFAAEVYDVQWWNRQEPTQLARFCSDLYR